MKKYIIKRILYIIPVFFVISVVVFLLIHLTPGDPARIILGDRATEAKVLELRETMGLNKPIVVQYVDWICGFFKGDWGQSVFMKGTMQEILLEHIKPTVSLSIYALLLALIFSIPLGTIAAKHRGSMADHAISVFSMFGISIPSFLMGLLLVLLMAVKLNILPSSGYKPIESGLLLHIKYLTLPAISLGLMEAGLITRMTRSALLEVLNADYIKMAKAKGVHPFVLTFKHAFRNALLPIITVIGYSFIDLLSGAVVVESIFNIPGVGQLIINSIVRRDYQVIQAIVLVIAIMNVVINLLVDLIYGIADPRVRLDK